MCGRVTWREGAPGEGAAAQEDKGHVLASAIQQRRHEAPQHRSPHGSGRTPSPSPSPLFFLFYCPFSPFLVSLVAPGPCPLVSTLDVSFFHIPRALPPGMPCVHQQCQCFMFVIVPGGLNRICSPLWCVTAVPAKDVPSARAQIVFSNKRDSIFLRYLMHSLPPPRSPTRPHSTPPPSSLIALSSPLPLC